MQTKKFVSLLDDHLKRQTEEGVLEDVWDGNIWKQFQKDPTDPSKQFLSNKFNLGLSTSIGSSHSSDLNTKWQH